MENKAENPDQQYDFAISPSGGPENYAPLKGDDGLEIWYDTRAEAEAVLAKMENKDDHTIVERGQKINVE